MVSRSQFLRLSWKELEQLRVDLIRLQKSARELDETLIGLGRLKLAERLRLACQESAGPLEKAVDDAIEQLTIGKGQ